MKSPDNHKAGSWKGKVTEYLFIWWIYIEGKWYIRTYAGHQSCSGGQNIQSLCLFGAHRTAEEVRKCSCEKLLMSYACESVQRGDAFQRLSPMGREQIFRLPKFLMNNRCDPWSLSSQTNVRGSMPLVQLWVKSSYTHDRATATHGRRCHALLMTPLPPPQLLRGTALISDQILALLLPPELFPIPKSWSFLSFDGLPRKPIIFKCCFYGKMHC